MYFRIMRLFFWLCVIALPMTSSAQEQDDFAQVAENKPPSQNPSPQEGRTIGQYIDHGDGTITDTASKLMWKRCSEGLSGVNCEEGESKGYKYDEAVEKFKNIEYAGFSDWRLPTVDELKTLVYCSKGVKDKDSGMCNDGSEQPTINQQAFPNTAGWYWSGSPSADYSDYYAWYVYFNYGYSSINLRDGYSYAVRLVRNKPNAEPPPQKTGQYIDHGDGTITDTASKLMWKRCSEGLSGVNCEEGESKGYKYDEAVEKFKNIEYAGFSDWRLPTVDELKTLVYCSKGVKDKDSGRCNDGSEQPMINQQAFPNTTMWYWSGSPYAPDSDYAWYVYFGSGSSVIFLNGISSIGTRYHYLAVRLVRGGQ